MPSFSKLVTSLTGFGFGYFRDSHHAAHTYGLTGLGLNKNLPRFSFEYFVTINLSQEGILLLSNLGMTASDFSSINPMVKSIDMPSMSIDTDILNEYNRKRITQTRVNFQPVKMVVHDVCDGKTLKFWQLYYEYYFKDGLAFTNNNKSDELGKQTSSNYRNYSDNLPGSQTPVNKFGYNIQQVKNSRNLIESIEVIQVHAKKTSKVTLVNPRISTFNHDTLAYSSGNILELMFMFEYEYAKYDTQANDITDEDLERYKFAEIMDLPSLAISTLISDKLSTLNPFLKSDNPIIQRIGSNVQSEVSNVVGSQVSGVTKSVSASVLDGMANITPKPVHPTTTPPLSTRSFTSKAKPNNINFTDVLR